MCLMDRKTFEDFVTIIWNIWNSRNNALYRGKEEDVGIIWYRAKALMADFLIHKLTNKSILPKTSSRKKWEKPPYGYIKINVDASMDGKIGIGVITRDCDGLVLGALRLVRMST